jgi:hypothetical protein
VITASTVKRLITKFGGPGTLRSKDVAYDPTSGKKGTFTPVLTPLVGVQVTDRQKYAPDSPFRTAEEVIEASCAIAPLPNYQVDWGRRRWNIRYVEKLDPSGQATLMYTLALSTA